MGAMRLHLGLFLILTLGPVVASAIMTEVSVSFSSKKTTFDKDNFFASQSLTGSVSFYIMERTAIEMSYTDALSVREEKLGDVRQTVVQTTQVWGSDLIYVFADKKAFFQPYVKGGVARITRKQEVKVDDLETFTVDPSPVVVPSYGLGLKMLLTETFSVKISYDAWKTPLEEGGSTDDASLRAGLSWIF